MTFAAEPPTITSPVPPSPSMVSDPELPVMVFAPAEPMIDSAEPMPEAFTLVKFVTVGPLDT